MFIFCLLLGPTPCTMIWGLCILPDIPPFISEEPTLFLDIFIQSVTPSQRDIPALAKAKANPTD